MVPALVLVLITLGLYWPALDHEFIDLDDGPYIYQNPNIKNGLTLSGLKWAFTQLNTEETYWHPVTWIGHMINSEFFGLNPAGHHLMSILWHALDSVLLYGLLLRLRQPLWGAILISGLFAWHPIQVDSVAWAAELKSQLAAFFWITATWAYVSYTEVKARSRLGISIGLYAVGLLCKPVLVTLPCTLVLLDFWPLRRLPAQATANDLHTIVPRLVVEKLPYLVFAIASAVITIAGHSRMGSLESLANSPLHHRVAMAAITYATYLRKMFWPDDLSVYYPYRFSFAASELLVSAAIVGGVLLVSLMQFRRRPALSLGWLWFLGVMFPMIGLIQAGPQQMGDRFMYIPSIGLFIVIAAALGRLAGIGIPVRTSQVLLPCLLLALCIVGSRFQLRYWRDTITVFTHAESVTPPNPFTTGILGKAYLDSGDDVRAARYVEATLRMNPKSFFANETKGNLLVKEGRFLDAIPFYKAALEIYPDRGKTLSNLGVAYANLKQHDEAVRAFTAAIRSEPLNGANHFNLAVALEAQGQVPSALASLRHALELDPDFIDARLRLAGLLQNGSNPVEAVALLRSGLERLPDSVPLIEALAFLLATHPDDHVRNGAEAVALAQQAVRLTAERSPRSLSALAAAFAEAGNFAKAVETQKSAISLLGTSVPQSNLEEPRKRLQLYESRQPLRIGPLPVAPSSSPSSVGPAR